MSFDKAGSSLLYFYGSHLEQVMPIEEIVRCKEKHILFEVLELTD